MFKFTSTVKHQSPMVFLAIFVMSIFNSKLNIYGDAMPQNEAGRPCHGVCTFEYAPVCGSHGETYSNMCQLNLKNKCDGTNIQKIHDGPCHHHPHCVPDMHPLICKCPCTLFCTTIFKPVCGTDGETYSNACELASRNACKTYPARVCHKGPCTGPFSTDHLADEKESLSP